MKKALSIFLSILLLSLCIVSCKPEYTPVGTDGFSDEQKVKINQLITAEENTFEKIQQDGTPDETGTKTTVTGGEIVITATEDSSSPLYVTTTMTVTDEFDVLTPNLKYNIKQTAKSCILKADGKTVYSLDGLVADGYATEEGGLNMEKIQAELTMKIDITSSIVWKDSSANENYKVNYSVSTTSVNQKVTVSSGKLSIDLGDGNGPKGSNEVNVIKEFFETKSSV